MLTSAHVLAYFSPKKSTGVIVDASPVGMVRMLMQEGKMICYVNQALTETEQKYSQTDKEMLAVVYGIKPFHLYLLRSMFTIITDH